MDPAGVSTFLLTRLAYFKTHKAIVCEENRKLCDVTKIKLQVTKLLNQKYLMFVISTY